MPDLKEKAKVIIKKLLRELDTMLDEAEKSGVSIHEIAPELIFNNVNHFAEELSNSCGFSKSTARNAIQELENDGEIEKSKHGYYELKHDTKKIDKVIRYQLYATPLPLQSQHTDIHYIEVTDNMSPFLAELFNRSMQRNDKRFYSVAPNLLLLLDLASPPELELIEKKPFDLSAFFKEYGISVRDYNAVCQTIQGQTFEDDFDASFEIHATESSSLYSGKLNTPRSIKPKKLLTED